MLTQDQIETMRAIAGKTPEGPGYDRVRLLPVWAWTSAWNGRVWMPVLTEAGREVLALCPVTPTASSDDADLADALAYAAEIDADPTPPTSVTHRWLVVLAKALRRVLKERNEAQMLADSRIQVIQVDSERLATLGNVLAKARGER